MIGSQGAKDELIQFLRETPYGRYKNNCGKDSGEYAHEILGRIQKPQRQFLINKMAKEELNQTIQKLVEQGVLREVKSAITNSPIQLGPNLIKLTEQ